MAKNLSFIGFKFTSVLVAVALVAGCSGNWKSTHNTTDFISSEKKKTKIISVDAEQRFGVIDEVGNFCAEPSPDSISALASAFGLNLSDPTGGVSGNVGGNSAESVASIGLRTQSIQLMRDAMYRICELKKNDALSNTSAYLLHSGYQDVMTALLAIEQLTGPVKAAQATLGGKTSVDTTQTVNEMKDVIAKLNDQKSKKEKEKSEAENEKNAALKSVQDAEKAFNDLKDVTNPAPTDEQIAAAKTDLDEKKVLLTEKETNVSNISSEISSIEGQLKLAEETKGIFAAIKTSTESNATLGAGIYASTVNKETVTVISKSVENIALAAINRDRITPACIIYLTELSSKITNARLDQFLELAKQSKLTAEFTEKQSNQNIVLTKAEEEVKSMQEVCSKWVDLKLKNEKIKGSDAGTATGTGTGTGTKS